MLLKQGLLTDQNRISISELLISISELHIKTYTLINSMYVFKIQFQI